jgi:hypothetical protein
VGAAQHAPGDCSTGSFRPAAASAGSTVRPRIRSAARSAIIIVGAFVLPRTSVGITEASTTRRPSMPRTRSRESTTACWSVPIRQEDTGWYSDSRVFRTVARRASRPCTVPPGDHSSASTEASGPADAISRAFSTPDTRASRSRSSVRYPASIAGAHDGSAERSRTEPRE